MDETTSVCSPTKFDASLKTNKNVLDIIQYLHLTVQNIVAGISLVSQSNTNNDSCTWEIKNGANQPTVTISFNVNLDDAKQLEPTVECIHETVVEYVELEDEAVSIETENQQLTSNEIISKEECVTEFVSNEEHIKENTTYVNVISDNNYSFNLSAENCKPLKEPTIDDFIKAVVIEENQMLHKPLETVEIKLVSKEISDEKIQSDQQIENSDQGEGDLSDEEKLKTISKEICIKTLGKLKEENVTEILKLGDSVANDTKKETRNSFRKQDVKRENKVVGKTPKVFLCHYCPKTFARKYDMTMHHRIHTGEKPFACRFCDKRFSQMNNKEVHERVHTGEKPYSCTYCDQTFKQTADKKKHERIHTGEKPYSCIHCGKSFARLDHKKSHERTHTGEKPFGCKYCEKRFTDSSTKAAHEKRHVGKSPYSQEPLILICTQ